MCFTIQLPALNVKIMRRKAFWDRNADKQFTKHVTFTMQAAACTLGKNLYVEIVIKMLNIFRKMLLKFFLECP